MFWVMALAGAIAPRPAWSLSAMPTMIAQVRAAFDQGDAQHAAILAEAALRESGVDANDRAGLLLYRGLARELLGARDAAMRDFTQALDTRALPRDERGEALLQRGFLHDGLGQLNEAVRDYTAAIALKGYSAATALNNRANIYRRRNKLEEARQDYLAALSADGGRPQYSYYGLGQIAEARHDSLAARGFYAEAAIADPDYGAASERLTALGGPPDGANFDRGEWIMLRAPAGKKADIASAPDTLPPGRTTSARLTPVNELALRPALDQSDLRASGMGGAQIQLGAWRSAAEARAGWDEAKARAGGALDGLSPQILVAELPGKGRYFRLRVSPGQSGAEVCARLAAKAVPCFPVKD